MTFTLNQWIALLPILAVAGTAVVVMLAIAVKRNHWWNATLCVAGLNGALFWVLVVFYFYEEPIEFAAGLGGVLDISCTYDTRGATSTVAWGEGTGDEMCIAAFYVTLSWPGDIDSPGLKAAVISASYGTESSIWRSIVVRSGSVPWL